MNRLIVPRVGNGPYSIGMSRSSSNLSDYLPHASDIVISEVAKAVYVVNLKAASSSIESWLVDRAAAAFTCVPPYNLSPRNQTCCNWKDGKGRLTTRCLRSKHRNYFIFTFVREPIAKFEAGVRQAWTSNPKLRRYSADELLINGALFDPAQHARDVSGLIEPFHS